MNLYTDSEDEVERMLLNFLRVEAIGAGALYQMLGDVCLGSD